MRRNRGFLAGIVVLVAAETLAACSNSKNQ